MGKTQRLEDLVKNKTLVRDTSDVGSGLSSNGVTNVGVLLVRGQFRGEIEVFETLEDLGSGFVSIDPGSIIMGKTLHFCLKKSSRR